MEDNEDQQEPTELMAEFLTQFMASGSADILYRQHYCDMVAQNVHLEFGNDGMCELMLSIDKTANWVSDIIFEAPELDNIAFKEYNIFDDQLVSRVRRTNAMKEFNDKLWRLRRKYAKLVVAEIAELYTDAGEEKQ